MLKGVDSGEDPSNPSSDSSSESDSDVETTGSATFIDQSPLNRILKAITEDVRCLYRISILLQRPAIRDKYIRSISKKEETTTFYFWDRLHILEKATQWARDVAKSSNTANITTISSDHPLIDRLAMANCRRREQLLYWKSHPDRPSIVNNHGSVVPILQDRTLKLDSRSQIGKSAVGQMQLERVTSKTDTKTQRTHQSMSTVAASALDEDDLNVDVVHTVYASSSKGWATVLKVPEVPKPTGNDKTFDCPYCFAKLNTQMMQQRVRWK